MQVQGDRLVIVIRLVEQKESERRRTYDVLSVRDIADLTPLWEYRDGGLFAGPVAVDDEFIYLAVSSGEVVTFR